MHGIVSLLSKEYSQQVESIWDMLDEECGLKGIRVTPIPHSSWMLGDDFDWNLIEKILHHLAQDTQAFTVNSGGLGIFPGKHPVIFIPVIRSQELNHFHTKVWQRVQPIGKNISMYYTPANWMPHISLAYLDVTRENILCAIQKLAFQRIIWTIQVDNIAIIYERDGEIGKVRNHYRFQSGISCPTNQCL